MPIILPKENMTEKERLEAILQNTEAVTATTVAKYFTEWCLTPDTEITTDNGVKPIRSIKIGDKVLTHRGRFCSVKRKLKRPYRGFLISIKTRYNFKQVRMTPDHRVLVRFNRRLLWVAAKNLRKGDIVLIPRFMQSIPPTGTLPVHPSFDFFRLIGYYTAEGSLGYRRQVTFTFNTKEVYWHSDVLRMFRRRFKGAQSGIFRQHNPQVTDVRIQSDALHQFFSPFGKGRHKHLPKWLLSSPKPLQIEFLKGYWRGDGGIDRTNGAIDFNTSSKALLYEVRFILYRLGFIPSTTKVLRRLRGAPYTSYKLRVSGKQRNRLARMLEIQETKPKLIQLGWKDWHFVYLQIRKIKRVKWRGAVYNLQVTRDQTYCTPFVSHNCENFRANLPAMWADSDIAEMPKVNHKRSAIIIGGGPSLAKHNHLEVLGKSDFDGDVFCCDKMFKPALAKGVKVNYVVNLDSSPLTVDFVNHVYSPNTALILTAMAHPDLRKAWQHKVYWFCDDMATCSHPWSIAEGLAIIAKKTQTSSGASVGGCCINMAWWTEHQPICLIGMDASYDVDEPLEHTPYWNNYVNDLGGIENAKLAFIKGRNPDFGNEFYIDYVFEIYRNEILNRIKHFKMPIINASGQGSLFGAGIKSMNFAMFLKKYGH